MIIHFILAMDSFKVTNVCAKFNLNRNVDLRLLRDSSLDCISSVKYEPWRFSAAICKYKENKLTFLVFRNGSVVIVGAKSVEQAIQSAEDFVVSFSNINCLKDFKITNVCCAASLTFHVNLVKLVQSDPDKSCYEPELFANMNYIFEDIKFTISHNGKVFGTGFKTESQAIGIFQRLITKLSGFAK